MVPLLPYNYRIKIEKMRRKILIVEDEESILMGLEDDLITEGYYVDTAIDGMSGLQKARKRDADLILLDVMLPGMDGFEICRKLREERIFTPIIMLTARSQEIDKVLGLEFGADDYVTKPFSLRELQARIKAVLRRRVMSDDITKIKTGSLEIDLSTNEVRLHGELIDLTHQEYTVLCLLASHEGKVMDRHDILNEAWGEDVIVSTRTIDTHITNLRKKLDDQNAPHSCIKGIRGIGYKFVPPGIDNS
jgi:two-component system alkaline phosphatase synthesis response regulator PhoP